MVATFKGIIKKTEATKCETVTQLLLCQKDCHVYKELLNACYGTQPL